MTSAPEVERRSLGEQTYEWIKERIYTGRLAPGDRISIDEVARSLGISRTPVRDAIHRLAYEGLAVVSARRGSAVARLSIEALRDTYLARSVIESAIAAAAATAAVEVDLSTLERIQLELEGLRPDEIYHSFATHSRYSELDVQFHQRIAATLRSKRIDRIVRDLAIQRQVAPLLFGTGYLGAVRRIAEHGRIVDALRARDPGRASNAMGTHVERSRADLLEFLGSRLEATANVGEGAGRPGHVR